MGSNEEVVSLGLEYTNVIFAGSIFFILLFALNSLLHAEGDTKTYRNVLVLIFFLKYYIKSYFNIWFFFIPAFGVKGIGIATIIAQLISFIIILIKVLKNQRVKKISL